jgi:hypothetical protein
MATRKQRSAARRNIRRAQRSSKSKRTLSRLPKRVRSALGRQANAVKRRRDRSRRK